MARMSKKGPGTPETPRSADRPSDPAPFGSEGAVPAAEPAGAALDVPAATPTGTPAETEATVTLAEPGAPARDPIGDAAAAHDPSPASPAEPPGEASDPPRGARTAPPGSPRPVPAPPAPASVGSGGSFVAGLVGGALAVAAGVGALWVSNPDLLRGQAPAPDFSPIEARLDEQAGAAAALSADLAALRAEVEAAPAADGGDGSGAEALARVETVETALAGRIEAVAAELAGLAAAVEVLDGRIGQVEVRPPVMAGNAAEATAEAIAELRAALDAERSAMNAAVAEARRQIEAAAAEAEALRDSAAASQRTTVARAALSRLGAALDAGGPFAAALSDLSAIAEVAVPPELIEAAETGVPTMDDLRRSFPDAARAALNAAVRAGVDAEAGALDRIGAFLRAQTGARSIAPREGGDPDAVLSRAEAALAEGRLDDALALADTLPEPARLELADWRAAAERRQAALAAAAALSAALPAN